MPELLAIENLPAGYGEAVVLSRHLALVRRGPVARAARPQRHGQDHAGQLDRRRHALSRRHDPARRARHHAAARRPARACRRRLGAAGAQHLQVAHRGREPHRRGAARGRGPPRRSTRCSRGWRERRRNLGNQLSGGEQQMLAVGRALILNPRIILLDEPLEGLAPIIVEELLARAAAHHPRGRPVGDPGRAERARRSSASPTAPPSSSAAASCTRRQAPRSPTDAAVLEKYLGVTHSERVAPGKRR